MSTLDLTKPCQTRDGRKVRILCTDAKDDLCPVVGLVTTPNGSESVEVWLPSGAAYQRHPVGTRVVVWRDNGEATITVTRSEAQVLSGHSAVIWLDGISGCYLLDRVRPAPESPS